MNVFNLSIRSLLHRQNNPAPKPKTGCLYFVKVSELIKSHYEKDGAYIDSHNECSKLKKRLPKRGCINCKLYKPIISDNGE